MQSRVCQHLRFLPVLLQTGLPPQGGWAHLRGCGTLYYTSQSSYLNLKVLRDIIPCGFFPCHSDIDECSQNVGHLCTYKCVNAPGSYQCACPEYGYTMSPNGRSCRGEHSCDLPKHALYSSFGQKQIQLCTHLTLLGVYSTGYAQINIIGAFTVAQ